MGMAVAAESQISFDAAEFRRALLHHVKYSLGSTIEELSPREVFRAVALAIRDRMVDHLLETERRYQAANAKRLYYLSMEFLIGRSLRNNLDNLQLWETCAKVLKDLGFKLEDIEDAEVDAALGNGGLGRLAACFLDSLATLGLPGFGYGINYEYGLFKQEIRRGEQIERPDPWRMYSTPWEIARPHEAVIVPVYGRVEHSLAADGHYNPMWLDWSVVIGVPFDVPIVGYKGETVNYLRLYSARASQDFNMSIFNTGDYIKAVQQKVMSETISKVLYPSDSVAGGQELRLIQEYFLVACAIRDIIRQFQIKHDDFARFPEQVAIQLNDTHPTLAVAELMRVLIDENDMEWAKAWSVTTKTFGYTNHTLLPEALEKWPVPLMERVLPRHLQIIFEINRQFLELVESKWPGDTEKVRRMSLIEEGGAKHVRMANLAIVGSHSVNGVAAVHSELVKTDLVPDFNELWPEKFNNKTNGVTQRRWLLSSNRGLSNLITEHIGDRWITHLDELRKLEAWAADGEFQWRFAQVKRDNKARLAKVVKETLGESVRDDSIFDVQVKRIHEYKRQLLNLLHVIHDYVSIVDYNEIPANPRTVIFAGKAAPGYRAAKQIIAMINHVAKVVNSDKRANPYLKVAFIPDYRVSLAEVIIPAADLSEQISTAGTEASGTGNMKFAMNGALTIGTMDGANIEIYQQVQADNIFIFGLSVDEVMKSKERGDYHPWEIYRQNDHVRRVVDAIRTNRFSPDEPGRYQWVVDALLAPNEKYLHLADFPSFLDAHHKAAAAYAQPPVWFEKAILNVARVGMFSSDRTIQQYADEIWKIKPVKSS